MWHRGGEGEGWIHPCQVKAKPRRSHIRLESRRAEINEGVCASLRIELQHQGAASQLAACLDVGKGSVHYRRKLLACLGCAELVHAFLLSVGANKRDGARESRILGRQKHAIDGVLSRRCPAYRRHEDDIQMHACVMSWFVSLNNTCMRRRLRCPVDLCL
jgi:hypothetical protein